jgi:hypothetical protein
MKCKEKISISCTKINAALKDETGSAFPSVTDLLSLDMLTFPVVTSKNWGVFSLD